MITGVTGSDTGIITAQMIATFGGLLIFVFILYGRQMKKWAYSMLLFWKFRAIFIKHKSGVVVLNDMITIENANEFEEILSEFVKNNIKRIVLILNTPGGYEFAMARIINIIKAFPGEIHAYIPRYSMSAGTAIALSCKSIHMGDTSSLGMLDPQMGILFWVHSSKAWQTIVKKKGVKAEDNSIAMSMYAKQYQKLIRTYLDKMDLLNGNNQFKRQLVYGDMPHAMQFGKEYLRKMNVQIQDMDIEEVNEIMEKEPKGLIYFPKYTEVKE